MKHLDMLWFAEMPQPAEWTPPKSLSGEPMVEIAARRGRIKSKLAEVLPSTNQGRDDTVDLKPLEDSLTTYLQLLEIHQNVVNSTVEANQPLPWKHSSIPQSVPLSLSWISMERGMIALCLACISALLAEKRDPSVVCVRDVWRKAAGYLNLAASFLPHHLGVHSTVQVWMHLCIVYAHTAEMSNVENAEECNDQIARYHSALSRSAHSECLAAHSYLSNFSSSYILGQQLRWLLLASTCLCKITFWWNEVELYAKRPQVALVLCNAILKTKLPMPPQYPHRSNVLYTKVMQSMVASHHEALKLAMDYKSANLMQVEKDDRVEIFLKIEPLTLKSLRPLDIRPSQPDVPSPARISSPPRSPVSNELPPSSISSMKSPLRMFNKSFRTESQPTLLPQQWTYGIEPFTPRLTRRGSSAPSLRSISNQEDTPEEFPCQSPKINRNMAITKRKCCGLCERAFPMANLEGVVLMKRILDLRAQWGLHTIDSPKCSPASYLYHNVRVCTLCNDILYGGNTNKKAHLPHLESSRNIREHVKHQRRISLLLHKPTAETSMKDEIGYMIHQSILNDALLLHEPANSHKYMDVTRRRGVTASQSSVLLLGVASNAINSMSRRAPWWEVDLGLHCDIATVEIWNCMDSDPQVAARLFPCHVLLLLKPGMRRSLIELQGVAVDTTIIASPSQPLRWNPKPGSVCRYVRIVVDKMTYLHFERVHVFGTPRRDDLVKVRPATAAKPPLAMRFQEDKRTERPKSAGFLMATASSQRRQQLAQQFREQLENQD